ncbi:hypothetical protein PFISCL1PPCAC_27758, partial [Pristionchus fissidentatus]
SKMFIVLFSLLAFGFAAPIESNGDSFEEVIDAPKEESIYEQVLQLVEPKLREHMLNQGIPEGAVEEFFVINHYLIQKSGFLYLPHDKKKLNEMVQWAKKWTKKHAEKQEKLNFDELHKFQIRVTEEVSSVFGHLFTASARVACLSKAKAINRSNVNEFKGMFDFSLRGTKYNLLFFPEVINKLSPIEQDLFKGV